MMRKIFFTILSIMSFTSFSFGQETPHLFVYLEEILEEKPKLTYGNFIDKEDLLVKDTIHEDEELFLRGVKKELEALPKEKQNVLIHIHGLWADSKSFYEEANYILQKKVFENPENQYGLIISLQWHGTFNYIEDYEITDQAGHLFEPIIENIDSIAAEINPTYDLAFFNHSMGNRVFHSILTHDYSSSAELDIDLILLCAADLKDTIFTESIMDHYTAKSDNTVVFYHKGDRTLRMAKRAVPGERLGINGPSNRDKLPDSVDLIETTEFNDFETWPGKMSKHRYYYDSDSARKIITNYLAKQE